MKRLRAAAAIILVLLLLCAALPCAVLAAGEGESHETTVLFTHDLHSHFLPQTAADGGESGGYARLATVLRQERAQHPDSVHLKSAGAAYHGSPGL